MPTIFRSTELQPTLPTNWVAQEVVPRGKVKKYRSYRQFAKIHYDCPHCSGNHSWSSMKGSVVFVIWSAQNGPRKYIFLEMYGQRCKTCKSWGIPSLYEEEFESLLAFITSKYDGAREPGSIKRSIGKPKAQHQAELCEACEQGVCTLVSEENQQ